jgi:Spy/CpxP family protein refolding chaperone
MMRLRMMVFCGLLIGAGISQARAETSPYAGMEERSIKALSAQQIEDLRAGRGMGMALAAELNGYPGPAHVIELADALKLSDEQLIRTRALFAEMQQKAEPLGNELLSKEAELEEAFAGAHVDDESLHRTLGGIARLQGELRYTHLKYHLAMRELLSPDQIAAYDRLRGYKGHSDPSPGMHGHAH